MSVAGTDGVTQTRFSLQVSSVVYFFFLEVAATNFFFRCLGIFSFLFSRLASLTVALCCYTDGQHILNAVELGNTYLLFVLIFKPLPSRPTFVKLAFVVTAVAIDGRATTRLLI